MKHTHYTLSLMTLVATLLLSGCKYEEPQNTYITDQEANNIAGQYLITLNELKQAPTLLKKAIIVIRHCIAFAHREKVILMTRIWIPYGSIPLTPFQQPNRFIFADESQRTIIREISISRSVFSRSSTDSSRLCASQSMQVQSAECTK